LRVQLTKMTLFLSTVTIILAFALAILGRFFSKEHVKANRAFVVISIANVIVALTSIVFASISQSKQNQVLTALNEAQRELLDKQDAQLRNSNELATKLTTAQRTTERISSELTSNTRIVGNVLHETERALEPLGALGFLCDMDFSSDDDDAAAIVRAVAGQRKAESTAPSDDEAKRHGILLPPPILGGSLIQRDSPLFPRSGSAFRVLVDSVQVLLEFFSKPARPETYIIAKPTPDLMTQILPSEQFRWLMVTPGKKLVLEISGDVPVGKWASTGSILSVKDLLQAQAVAQPLFSLVGTSDQKEHDLALRKWGRMTIQYLAMYTGDGRRWILDTKTVKVVKAENIPLFVGKFKGPVKPNHVLE
jgi:hypothetical protein